MSWTCARSTRGSLRIGAALWEFWNQPRSFQNRTPAERSSTEWGFRSRDDHQVDCFDIDSCMKTTLRLDDRLMASVEKRVAQRGETFALRSAYCATTYRARLTQ